MKMRREPWGRCPAYALENGFSLDLIEAVKAVARDLKLPVTFLKKNGDTYIAIRIPDEVELARIDAATMKGVRDSYAEQIAERTVDRKMDQDDLIRMIHEATGITVAETDDLLESLTDDQVRAVWLHMKGGDAPIG
jgi:hypothetical protein